MAECKCRRPCIHVHASAIAVAAHSSVCGGLAGVQLHSLLQPNAPSRGMQARTGDARSREVTCPFNNSCVPFPCRSAAGTSSAHCSSCCPACPAMAARFCSDSMLLGVVRACSARDEAPDHAAMRLIGLDRAWALPGLVPCLGPAWAPGRYLGVQGWWPAAFRCSAGPKCGSATCSPCT